MDGAKRREPRQKPARLPAARLRPALRRLRVDGVDMAGGGGRVAVMEGSGDFWVFGYGSLMWRPGFPHGGALPALLRGYHRSFCVYSHHYRGTPEQPGLVLGLAPGGSCRGVAFRVPRDEEASVRDYLDERELVSYAYIPRMLPVEIPGCQVEAYTFVADPAHRQFAGQLGVERSAEIIMEAKGIAGLNRDYLINTVRHLERHGFGDDGLHPLLKRVEYLTGVIEAGGGI